MEEPAADMRILVIGAYGLIGSYVAARLLRDGHEVIGAGRDVRDARRRQPAMRWIEADLRTADGADWLSRLAGVDAVVNCAGALQDSPRDDLRAVHLTGVAALTDACVAAGVRRFVQISAPGVETGPGAFSRTKAEGDAALRATCLDWVILRPGLVLAPAAYGGSALLRALAAFPGVTPAVHADAVVQVVSVEDVAEAAARAVGPEHPARFTADLVAPEPTTLAELLEALRSWLGYAPAPVLVVPRAVGAVGSAAADALAALGWRSPMRSTALAQLSAGVRGDAADAPRLLGFVPRSLPQILTGWPAGVQDRWFARLYLLKPVMLGGLALFWLVSGALALIRPASAAEVLARAGLDEATSLALVLGGGVMNVLLGVLACFRRTAPLACLGMIGVTLAYLAGASVWRPDLWGDPLGPLVKTLPALILALAALAVMDER